jgi:hypothetical protein
MASRSKSSPVLSAARTTSGNSGNIDAPHGAVMAVLDVTAVTGTTPTLNVTITALDALSGKYVLIGAFAQKIAAATEAIFVGGPGDTKFVTETIRIEWVIAGTTPSFTFTVGLQFREVG